MINDQLSTTSLCPLFETPACTHVNAISLVVNKNILYIFSAD